MDEIKKRIGTFQNGLIVATAWHETSSDAEGQVEWGWIDLRNGRGEVLGIQVNQIPELVAALERAVGCIRSEAPGAAVKFDPAAVFGPGSNP